MFSENQLIFAVLFAIGFYGSLYGFHKWYKKIQPMSPFYNINTEKIIRKKKERDSNTNFNDNGIYSSIFW